MIIVFGSLSMDMALRVDRLPEPGDAVLTSDYTLYPGGRGANQALAAARAGAKVVIVGRVGTDNYGRLVTDSLKKDGVIVSGVAKSDDHPTGSSVIIRSPEGKNRTIVMTGANVETSHEQIPDEILIKQNMLLMQMELPVEQTVTLLERAKAQGVTTVLNLAPAASIPQKMLGLVDYLIINSIEARQIASKLGMTEENNALKIAHALSVSGQLTCILTLSKRGAVAVTKDGKAWGVPTMPVDQSQIVDVTGAGDAYCGTFAAAIHNGLPLEEAMRRASVAGTLSCFKEGGQESFPFLDDIETALVNMPQAASVAL
jgi:ribokinase